MTRPCSPHAWASMAWIMFETRMGEKKLSAPCGCGQATVSSPHASHRTLAWQPPVVRLGGGALRRQSPPMTTQPYSSVGHELERVLNATAGDLALITDTQAREPISPGKWSRKEIVGH